MNIVESGREWLRILRVLILLALAYPPHPRKRETLL
jgi:hypothetical protein